MTDKMADSLLQWDDEEKTMLRFAWQGDWEWDVYYEFHERAWEMVKEVDHDVHIIYDVRKINNFGKNALTHFGNMAKKYPSNVGKIVGVGTNAFQRAIGNMYNSIAVVGGKVADGADGQLLLYNKLEEAHAALKEWKETA